MNQNKNGDKYDDYVLDNLLETVKFLYTALTLPGLFHALLNAFSIIGSDHIPTYKISLNLGILYILL